MGYIRRAAAPGQAVPRPTAREGELAATLIALGQAEDAAVRFEALVKAEDVSMKELVSIAIALARNGQRARVEPKLEDILAVGLRENFLWTPTGVVKFAGDYAPVLMALGRSEEARRIAGLAERAAGEMKAADQPSLRLDALISTAAVLHAAGENESAARLMRDAESGLGQIERRRERFEVARSLAELSLEVTPGLVRSRLAAALEAAQAHDEFGARATRVAAVAGLWARFGELHEARRVAEMAGDPDT